MALRCAIGAPMMRDRTKQLIALALALACIGLLVTWQDGRTRANGGRYDAGGIWQSYR